MLQILIYGIIWYKWNGLNLCDVVHDIFNVDDIGVVEYAKNRMEYIKNSSLNKNIEVVWGEGYEKEEC